MATTFIYLPPSGGSGSAYWDDAVATVGDLPAVDNTTGEVRMVQADHSLRYWDGSAWQVLIAGPAGTYVLKTGDTMSGDLTISTLTASRALVTNGSKTLTSSATTATEVGYLSGVTSGIQGQLDTLTSNLSALDAEVDTKVTGPGSATDNALTRYDGTTGKLVQNSAVTLDDAGGMTFNGTTGFLRLPNLTTTQRDALTPADGMVLFNTTTSRFQGYFSGSWSDLHGWGS